MPAPEPTPSASGNALSRWLRLPETAALDLDDPRLTELRFGIIERKPFLRRVYLRFYRELLGAARTVPAGPHLELGAGGGFLKELAPKVLTSEFLAVRGVDVRASAESLPFADASLAAVYMLDVLHHLPHPRDYFAELARCLKPGGRAIMIEPYLSTWSRFVYTRLHHEPVDPDAPWELASSGPLSSANTALPWIVFQRDLAEFCSRYPQLSLVAYRPFMPFSYILSGGVSLRSLAPGFSFSAVQAIETALSPLNRWLAMFCLIVLERRA